MPRQQPGFLVIGAPKCGTTSVYHYLNQHPRIFLCPKETHYFIRNDQGAAAVQTQSWPDYLSLFDSATPDQVCGEVAVRYLYSSAAMKEIHERLPSCRLIVMLRDPVERTFSHYLMRFRTGGFAAEGGAVIPQDSDIRQYFSDLSHDIVQWSQYSRYLKQWLELFPPEQMTVVRLSDLQHDPAETMRRLFDFLGVDTTVPVNTEQRYNVSQAADFNPIIVRLKRIRLLRKLRNSRFLRAVAAQVVPRRLRDRLIWRPGKSGAHISESVQIPNDVKARLEELFADETDALGGDTADWLCRLSERAAPTDYESGSQAAVA